MSTSNHNARPRATGVQLALELPASRAGAAELPAVEVRSHPRARRLSVQVQATGRIVVVAPRRTSAEAVRGFVAEHRDWILRTYQQLGPLPSLEPPAVIRLPAVRLSLPVRYRSARGERRGWRERDGLLEVNADRNEDGECARVLRDWLRQRARREVPQRLHAVSEKTGLFPRRLQFRLQKSRWGSCSSSGTISLNACLLFLEEHLMEYLFLHELCHLRHMNHSRRFWALMARFEPDCRRCERALDEAWKDIPGWALTP